MLTLLASVPWVYGDIARYTGTLALAKAKSKSTRVLAAIELQVSGSLEVGCGPENGWVHRRLRRGDHLDYAFD